MRVYITLYPYMMTRENTDIIKRPIVCAHKSFCFSFGM